MVESEEAYLSGILALTVTEDGMIYAASSAGLHRSSIECLDWQLCLPPIGSPSIPVTALATSSGNRVFAAIPGGIGYSDDHGASWEFRELPLPAPLITVLVTADEAGLVFAGTESDGIFRSEDGGDSWSAWNFGLLDTKVTAIAVTSSEGVLAGTSSGLFQSMNHGRSWSPVQNFRRSGEILAIAERDRFTFLSTSLDGTVVHMGGLDQFGMYVTDLREFEVSAIEIGPGETLAALVDDSVWASLDFGYLWSSIPVVSNRKISAISRFVKLDGEQGVFAGSTGGSVRFMPIGGPELSEESSDEQ